MSTLNFDTAEFESLVGSMLEQLAPRLNELGMKWIADQRDVGDLAMVVRLTPDGDGTVAAVSRSTFRAQSTQIVQVDDVLRHREGVMSKMCHEAQEEIQGGPRHLLPAAFFFMNVEPSFYVAWIEHSKAGEAVPS